MRRYKPLLSSAPAHSILNARTFAYTNSASTDIRVTFARVRRGAAKQPSVATNVRALPTSAAGALAPSASLRPLRQSSG
jgi:hypothetical protein